MMIVSQQNMPLIGFIIIWSKMTTSKNIKFRGTSLVCLITSLTNITLYKFRYQAVLLLRKFVLSDIIERVDIKEEDYYEFTDNTDLYRFTKSVNENLPIRVPIEVVTTMKRSKSVPVAAAAYQSTSSSGDHQYKTTTSCNRENLCVNPVKEATVRRTFSVLSSNIGAVQRMSQICRPRGDYHLSPMSMHSIASLPPPPPPLKTSTPFSYYF